MPLKIVMPEGTAEGALVQAGETRLVVKDGCVTGADDDVRLIAEALSLAAVEVEAPAPSPPPKAEKANGPKE